LIVGKKRWVLFPPHVPKHVVRGRGLVRDDEDDEAIHYFMTILPRIKRKATAVSAISSLRDGYGDKNHEKKRNDYRNFACYEFTQHAGETVFVPTGWWHAVLNLTDTVGCTQNFVSPRNFEKCWVQTRSGRKRMAWKWLQQLDQDYPHLAATARQLNERDRFEMKYDPEVIKRRKAEDRERRARAQQKRDKCL